MARTDEEHLRTLFDGDVAWLAVSPNVDPRGRLVEFDLAYLPFAVRRVFAVTDVPAGTGRGGHRHRRGSQALFCVSGAIGVELRRGDTRAHVTITPATGGLYIAAGIWALQRYMLEGSHLLVLASEPFDPSSYQTNH